MKHLSKILDYIDEDIFLVVGLLVFIFALAGWWSEPRQEVRESNCKIALAFAPMPKEDCVATVTVAPTERSDHAPFAVAVPAFQVVQPFVPAFQVVRPFSPAFQTVQSVATRRHGVVLNQKQFVSQQRGLFR